MAGMSSKNTLLINNYHIRYVLEHVCVSDQKDNRYEILNCVAKSFNTSIPIKDIFRKYLI